MLCNDFRMNDCQVRLGGAIVRKLTNRIAEILAAALAAFAVYIAGFGIFDPIIVFGGQGVTGAVGVLANCQCQLLKFVQRRML